MVVLGLRSILDLGHFQLNNNARQLNTIKRRSKYRVSHCTTKASHIWSAWWYGCVCFFLFVCIFRCLLPWYSHPLSCYQRQLRIGPYLICMLVPLTYINACANFYCFFCFYDVLCFPGRSTSGYQRRPAMGWRRLKTDALLFWESTGHICQRSIILMEMILKRQVPFLVALRKSNHQKQNLWNIV